MEEPDNHIDEASQSAHSDELKAPLQNSVENPGHTNKALNTRKSSNNRLLEIIVAVFVVIMLVAIAVLAFHKFNTNNGPLAVTLYYSDGHTVLWQGNNLASPTIPASNNSAFIKLALSNLKQQHADQKWQHGSYKVVTTLNLNLQNLAEKDVQNNSANVATVGGDEQAMVAEDVKTGQIVAYIGNASPTNSSYGQNDYANTKLSPGATMMPFVYAALIQNNTNVGAGSVISDAQQPLPGYPCTNTTSPAIGDAGNCLFDANYNYPGQETIRYALAGSRNVPAVEASNEILPGSTSSYNIKSIDRWISMANSAIGQKEAYACYSEFGSINNNADQTQCYTGAAIGNGDIAINQEINGDATLARLGNEVPEAYILKITSGTKVTYAWQQPKSTEVYSPDTAYIINNILDDPNASYLPAYQKFQNYNGWDIAVKTGTENSSDNGLMTAWSSKYAVVGFAGSDTLNKQLQQGHFEDITEPITKTWMEQALSALHTSPVNWTQPKDIKTLPGFAQTSFQDYGAVFPGPSTDIYPAWYK
jgi:membrane peptidoglycan carboxypeptidase